MEQNNHAISTSTINIKSIDSTGVFTGYASVFNVIDEQNDSIQSGAFKKCISKPSKIKLLWQHNTSEPIGIIEELNEDAHGLYIKARLLLDLPKARETYSLIKNEAISGLSIGYRIDDFNYDLKGVRYIKRLTLLEISVVTFPANTEATITNVKGYNDFKNLCNALDRTISKLRSFI